MPKQATFRYKCRACNTTFTGLETDEQFRDIHAPIAPPGLKVLGGVSAQMTIFHECGVDKAGVADLIGYEVKEVRGK
jgi:hypothetical protein